MRVAAVAASCRDACCVAGLVVSLVEAYGASEVLLLTSPSTLGAARGGAAAARELLEADFTVRLDVEVCSSHCYPAAEWDEVAYAAGGAAECALNWLSGADAAVVDATCACGRRGFSLVASHSRVCRLAGEAYATILLSEPRALWWQGLCYPRAPRPARLRCEARCGGTPRLLPYWARCSPARLRPPERVPLAPWRLLIGESTRLLNASTCRSYRLRSRGFSVVVEASGGDASELATSIARCGDPLPLLASGLTRRRLANSNTSIAEWIAWMVERGSRFTLDTSVLLYSGIHDLLEAALILSERRSVHPSWSLAEVARRAVVVDAVVRELSRIARRGHPRWLVAAQAGLEAARLLASLGAEVVRSSGSADEVVASLGVEVATSDEGLLRRASGVLVESEWSVLAAATRGEASVATGWRLVAAAHLLPVVSAAALGSARVEGEARRLEARSSQRVVEVRTAER